MQYRLLTNNLREAAKQHGDHSGYAIAKRTGLTEPTISKLLNSKTQPGLNTLLAFRRAYGCTIDDLIEEVDTTPAEAAA